MHESSFKRTKRTHSSTGAGDPHASTSVVNTSTGVPSLDDILGGGLPLSTSLAILSPDPHSAHGELLAKYFIAQGIACGQNICICDDNGTELAESCMWVAGEQRDAAAISGAEPVIDEDNNSSSRDEQVKIAWRYQNMRQFQTTVAGPSGAHDNVCYPFDLTAKIPGTVMEHAISTGQLTQLELEGDIETDICDYMIRKINVVVHKNDSFQKPTRLVIPSLGSPAWGDMTPPKILYFLQRLRAVLQSSQLASAFVCLASYVCHDAWGGPGWHERLGWVSDGCITLSSFSADPSRSNLLPSHHGLLQIHSLPRPNSVVPPSDKLSTLRGLSSASTTSSAGGAGENNLAFKVTRKRFLFETFHLDVEGGVGERRTTPASTTIAAQNDIHIHPHESLTSIVPDAQTASAIQVEYDQPLTAHTISAVATITVKPKKKVGFKTVRPDVLDF